MYEIRLIFEERCTRYAIKNMSDEDLKEIIELLDLMEASEAAPAERGFTARRNFYARFYECADRPLMREQILLLRDNVSRYHRLIDHGHAHDAHVRFREAILARDAKSAARILVQHLQEARDDLLASLEDASTPDA
jgi:DNA-binding GntR family transcriptional regulator